MTCRDKFLRRHHYFQGSTHHPYTSNTWLTLLALLLPSSGSKELTFFPLTSKLPSQFTSDLVNKI